MQGADRLAFNPFGSNKPSHVRKCSDFIDITVVIRVPGSHTHVCVQESTFRYSLRVASCHEERSLNLERGQDLGARAPHCKESEK